MKRSAAALPFLAVALTGCTTLTSPARVHSLVDGQAYWFDYDASRRGSVLVRQEGTGGKSGFRSCSEPAPDVAVNLASRIESQLSYRDITAEAKGDLALQAVKLADRSQMVLFFREALFRLCELSANQSFSNGEITGLYTKIIDTALRLGNEKALDADILQIRANLAQTESTIASAAAARARAEADKAKADDETERRRLQQQIDEMDRQIARAGEEKKALAQQLLSANQVKQAEVQADNTRANAAQARGEELSKDPRKAMPVPPVAAR